MKIKPCRRSKQLDSVTENPFVFCGYKVSHVIGQNTHSRNISSVHGFLNLSVKKAFTRIRTTLPQKTNRVQSSLHRVKRFLHLLSNSSPPSQKRGFLHETGFLRYKFSTSHFIDARVFFKVPTLKWCVFLLNEINTTNKHRI